MHIPQEKINQLTNNSARKTHKYTYDNLNQLIKEEVYNENTLILNSSYSYDILGNITSISRSTKLQEYSNLPSLINYYYEDTKDKTKLTKYVIDGTEFTMTYDSYNNLTKLNNYDITLLEGKITLLSYENIDQVRYTYDATGRRIKKEIYNQNTSSYDVINYVYLNDVLIKEIHSDKTITYILDDTGIIGFKVKTSTTEETYYYIKNTQQDIISIVDDEFNEVANYEYDAYGNIVNINEVNQNQIAKLNPYRYRSYYYDIETDFYYLNARYYNPEIGRFITADDIEYLDTENMNGLNLYCYCLNNPSMHVDASGHFPILAAILVFTGLLLVLTGDSYKEYESNITSQDLDINGNNSGGNIKVTINSSSINIANSKDIKKDEDITRVLELIMDSDEYKNYNYNRTLDSYKSEWKAHNVAYYLYKKGDWGIRTGSVDLNKN